MIVNRFAIPALAFCLGATCLISSKTVHAAPAAGFIQERGWDAPPDELNETERRGFHDGMEGARKDFENHRRPDVENRDEFKHPDLPRELHQAYRQGFRRGYDRAVAHFWGAPAMPAPMPMAPPPVREPERRGWDAVPDEFTDVQRRGYHDGMEGARKDVENHRRPDVNNRDEYKHPDLPRDLREAYREGFRRGYDVAMRHYMNDGPR
jgi:hypothetical protein